MFNVGLTGENFVIRKLEHCEESPVLAIFCALIGTLERSSEVEWDII